MAREVTLLALLLSGCSPVPGVSVSPGIHCTGRIDAEIALGERLLEGWSARVAEVVENCGPTVRVTVESYSGE